MTVISLVVAITLLAAMATGTDADPPALITEGVEGPARSFRASQPLTADDVRLVIAQAVTQAVAMDKAMTVVVTDRGGTVLGAFRMTGAEPMAVIDKQEGEAGQGLERVEVGSELAALSKAGTASFFATTGNAFTTRTASDIIQEHRPRTVAFTPSGPLFGVQFSSLPCTDIKNNPPLPLGLAGDPGGLPLYKNNEPVGAIGVEEDGNYGLDRDPFDNDQPAEELIALAGSRGFEAPAAIRGDTILLDGVRLTYVNVEMPPILPLMDFEDLPGEDIQEIGIPAATDLLFKGDIQDTPNPDFGFAHATLGGLAARIAVDAEGKNRFPIIDSPTLTGNPSALTKRDVATILFQALERAYRTRAAIRQPPGSFAEVNIMVVNEAGQVLGYIGTPDAPFFGFDVSTQKARTSAFFSHSQRHVREALLAAATDTNRLATFVEAAQQDGLLIDDSIVAFSDRGAGFLNRPLFPDGIDETAHGPFSRPIESWSPFNVGLQLQLVIDEIKGLLEGDLPGDPCTSITGLKNGIQIFAGSVPLFKDGRLAGSIGISGDGIDQDDLVAATGSIGFEAPPELRSDRVFVRGVRLPFVRFPRNPDL